EDCPYGSHCDSASGRCSYQCLSTDDEDPDYDCEGGAVCDCLGRCVPPTGQPIDIDPERVLLSIDKDVIQVASPNWGTETFEITLRADHNPMVSPAVMLRAPSGVFLLTDSMTW